MLKHKEKDVRTQIIDLDPDCGKSVPFDDDPSDEKSILNAATSKEGQAGWQVKSTSFMNGYKIREASL